MRIKKSGGKIFGAELTSAEKKALDLEIKRQLEEYDKKHIKEFDAMILWVLYSEFDFDVEDLKRYRDKFHSEIEKLIQRYELDDSDDIWLCSKLLKEIGVDLDN